MMDAGTITVVVKLYSRVFGVEPRTVSHVRQLAGITLEEALKRLMNDQDSERLPQRITFLHPAYFINDVLISRWEWSNRILLPGDVLRVNGIERS